jgi:hypothetical protein
VSWLSHQLRLQTALPAAAARGGGGQLHKWLQTHELLARVPNDKYPLAVYWLLHLRKMLPVDLIHIRSHMMQEVLCL